VGAFPDPCRFEALRKLASSLGHSMSSRSSSRARSACAARTRARAKRERGTALVPSHQALREDEHADGSVSFITQHAPAGSSTRLLKRCARRLMVPLLPPSLQQSVQMELFLTLSRSPTMTGAMQLTTRTPQGNGCGVAEASAAFRVTSQGCSTSAAGDDPLPFTQSAGQIQVLMSKRGAPRPGS
jgi:hypothetical protein